MEGYHGSGRRHFKDHVFVWDKKFAVRQENAYIAERRLLKAEDNETIITAFINQFGSWLDPPQYSYRALRDFLEKAIDESGNPENILNTDPTPAPHSRILVLLDDRRDETGWHDAGGARHRARDWNSYAEGYPPQGESIECSMLNAGDLYRKQLRSVGLS